MPPFLQRSGLTTRDRASAQLIGGINTLTKGAAVIHAVLPCYMMHKQVYACKVLLWLLALLRFC